MGQGGPSAGNRPGDAVSGKRWARIRAPSGDKVISGYFYADPADFAYGSQYNPEVFVKIYIAVNGWCNMAFNHVTVDDVIVYSAHNYTGTANQTGTASLNTRLVEHQYTGVGIQTGSKYDGTWKGGAIATTLTSNEGDPCGGATLTLYISKNTVTGSAKDIYGETYNITGNVDGNGIVTAGFAEGEETSASFTGEISGSTASGDWHEYYGCKGTWSVIKQ